MRTYTPKMSEVERQWWVVDADGQNLGRLASAIATRLRGKHRPDFTPHLDLGDHVIVINAALIATTGARLADKMYYSHSGYPGGLAETSLGELLAKHPDRVLKLAVRGMLPRNRLGRAMIKKLRVYGGAEHPHAAQKPNMLVVDTSLG
ncbi:MAG: 50S ribosomal protein L13 [Ardenticatenales bacterium]